MLESCSDLARSEDMLRSQLGDITLLGELGLTRGDYERLSRFIHTKVGHDFARGMRAVSTKAPTALACFLVAAGTYGYEEGDYWSAVWNAVGHHHDPNRERRLGKFFLRFLRDHGLPLFRIHHSYRYVTPILLHGGIPVKCLPEYFERILLPALGRDPSMTLPPEALVEELRILRQDELTRVKLEVRLSQLRKKSRELRSRIRGIETLQRAREEILRLQSQEAELAALGDLNRLSVEAHSKLQATYEASLEQIEALDGKRKRCEAELALYTPQDRVAVEQASAFQTWMDSFPEVTEWRRTLASIRAAVDQLEGKLVGRAQDVFSERWRADFGVVLQRLDLDQLEELLTGWGKSASQAEGSQTQLASHNCQTEEQTVPKSFAVLALVFAGLLLVALGAFTSLPAALTAVGVASLGAAGYIHLRSVKTLAQHRRSYERPRDAIDQAEDQRFAYDAQIEQALQELPIKSVLLERPSSDLPAALRETRHTYEQLTAAQDLQGRLQDKIAKRTERLKEIAQSLCLEPLEDVSALIQAVSQRIQQAEQHRVRAAEAIARLRDAIKPEIQSARSNLASTRQSLEWTETKLRSLGEGSIEAGLRKVEELERIEREVAQQRVVLAAKYPDLDQIEHDLRVPSDHRNEDVPEVKQELRELQTVASDLMKSLEHLSIPYQGIDEPIRKYLLYGGPSSEYFLQQSMILLQRARSGTDITEEDDQVLLPDHVLKVFEEWWTKYTQTRKMAADQGIEKQSDGQRFQTPVIGIDTSLAEVTLTVSPQICLAAVGGDHLELGIKGDESGDRQEVALATYRQSRDLLRTEESIVPLTFPARQYTLDLRGQSKILRSWVVPLAREEANCYVFDVWTGRALPEGAVPRSMVWIVSKDIAPADESLIRETGRLYGRWRDHRFWAVDLSDTDTLSLADATGSEYAIPVAAESSAGLGLVGGHRRLDISSQGAPVYTGPPPEVHIPIDEESSLPQWRFAIYRIVADELDTIAYGRITDFSEGREIQNHDNCVRIDLTSPGTLGTDPMGIYQIHVRKSPYIDWHTRVCLVPRLGLCFEKALYVPSDVGHSVPVRATATIEEQARLVVEPPARVEQAESGKVELETTTAQDVMAGYLSHPQMGSRIGASVPLRFRIPKVRWRLQGDIDLDGGDWQDSIRELWLGEWDQCKELFLIVDLGGCMDETVRLALGGRDTASQVQRLLESRTRFDLLPFRDELRAMPGLQTMFLSVPALGMSDISLFRIRTRWEAKDIVCTQRTEGDRIILDVSWSEVGRTEGKKKVLRLWRLAASAVEPVLCQQVSGESHEIDAPNIRLRPGQYLLELALEDPWSSTSAEPPQPGSPNTRLVTIESGRDPLQDATLRVRYVGERNRHDRYKLRSVYTFHIIGKIIHHRLPPNVTDESVLVTQTNEGWYVAEVDVLDDLALRHEILGANPVKIEYDARRNELSCAEDRAGDGAMYCSECQRLHWRQETIKFEEGRYHTLIGPIERFFLS